MGGPAAFLLWNTLAHLIFPLFKDLPGLPPKVKHTRALLPGDSTQQKPDLVSPKDRSDAPVSFIRTRAENNSDVCQQSSR